MNKRPKKVDDFLKFQEARNNCFRSFYKKYGISNDIEESIQKALDVAKINKNVLNLNPKIYKGLIGEIIFYGKTFESLDSDPLKEIGKTPADFFSPITNKYYDVTTNMNYKDIGDYLRDDNREYELAYVDIKSEEIEYIPISFPYCPSCGEYSHYIFFLDDNEKTELTSAIDYPDQDLVQYCSHCSYSEEIGYSNYYIFSPETYLEDEFEFGYRSTPEAKKYLYEKWTEISNLARKEFDYFISAITCLETEMYGNKHNIWTIEKPKWIHPILDLDKKPDRKIYFTDDDLMRNL